MLDYVFICLQITVCHTNSALRHKCVCVCVYVCVCVCVCVSACTGEVVVLDVFVCVPTRGEPEMLCIGQEWWRISSTV